MPLDDIVAVIGRFDGFDFGEFGINICLNIRTHEFENFIEKQRAAVNNFVGERMSRQTNSLES